LYLISANIFILKYVFGLVFLLIIPGILIVDGLLIFSSLVSFLGLSTLFGISLNLILIQIMQSIQIAFLIELTKVTFQLVVMSFNFILVTGLIYLRLYYYKYNELENDMPFKSANPGYKKSLILLIVFFLAIYLRSSNITLLQSGWVGSDSGLFLDLARNINEGKFTTNALSPKSPYWYDGKMINAGGHIAISHFYSVFFFIGDSSMHTALISIVLIGGLVIFPVYEIAYLLFSENVGYISILILTIHPHIM